MDKVKKDGNVAVLISTGYGEGWSSCNDFSQRDTLCMDARIVKPALDGDIARAVEIAEELCPDLYTGGADTLEVVWVKEGSRFEIREYDGHEYIHVIGDHSYMVA